MFEHHYTISQKLLVRRKTSYDDFTSLDTNLLLLSSQLILKNIWEIEQSKTVVVPSKLRRKSRIHTFCQFEAPKAFFLSRKRFNIEGGMFWANNCFSKIKAHCAENDRSLYSQYWEIFNRFSGDFWQFWKLFGTSNCAKKPNVALYAGENTLFLLKFRPALFHWRNCRNKIA